MLVGSHGEIWVVEYPLESPVTVRCELSAVLHPLKSLRGHTIIVSHCQAPAQPYLSHISWNLATTVANSASAQPIHYFKMSPNSTINIQLLISSC